MDLQNQSLHLVLSTDAKPRLKWTPELHQRFIEAVNQLGGVERATPKSLMRVMEIPGLTLYHLKSHLQKFRLGKSQQSDTCSDNKQEDYREIQSSGEGHCSREINVGTQNQITESLQIAQALQMQMEVQKKLYEQIEKRLQLRIEAQGKYLQSVLKKAQEALAGYNPSTSSIELAKSELSQLLSIINNGCPSSPISELTETRDFSFKDGERKQNKGTMCSLESSLTSSESSGGEEEKQPMEDSNKTSLELSLMDYKQNKGTMCSLESSLTSSESSGGEEGKQQESNKTSLELSLMDYKPEVKSKQANGRRRSEEDYYDRDCVEKQFSKRCGNKLRRLEFCQMIDLNRQYQGEMTQVQNLE